MYRNFFTGISGFFLLFAFGSALSVNLYAQPKKPKPNDKKQQEAARKLVAEGDVLYRQKQYRPAIEKYDQAIATANNFALAHFSKGYAHFYLNEYDQAVAALDSALSLGYKPTDIYDLRWQAKFMKRDYDGALADAQAAMKIVPNNPYYHVAVGEIYHEKGATQEAINSFKKAIELGSTNTDVNYYLAKSYGRAGDFSQQAIAADAAVKKGTKFQGESWLLIGQSREAGKEFAAAADAYEKALTAKPNLYELYGNLSDLYRRLNRYDQALATIKKGIQVRPNDGALFAALSWYYSLADNTVGAVAAGQEAIKYAPDQPAGYTKLCRAYADNKMYSQAVQICNKAIEMNASDGEASLFLARAYDFQKKPDSATPYYKKAVEGLVKYTADNPENADALYLLGNAYYANGNRMEAINAYKKSLALAPVFSRTRYNLGYMYVLDGNKTAAREQYSELQKLDAELAGKLLEAINK